MLNSITLLNLFVNNIKKFRTLNSLQWNSLNSNSLISNIALLATNLQVPGEDFVLILFPY